MNVAEIIFYARAAAPQLPDTTILQSLAYEPARQEDGDIRDQHEQVREAVCISLNKDLHPEDRMFIRYLLQQEIIGHQFEREGMLPNIKRCAYLLYRLGRVEDSLLIWEAKDTHFDTMLGIDVQLLIGAGLDQTLAYIQTQPHTDDMREYLEACRASGDFTRMDAFHEDIENYFLYEDHA